MGLVGVMLFVSLDVMMDDKGSDLINDTDYLHENQKSHVCVG